MKILCVDDDVFVRDALYLKGLSKFLPDDDIVSAASGEEALEKIEESRFDMVITDLVMPGISGIDVLKAVKENDATIEVILVTGAASIASAVEAIRNGARDFIEKPISIDLLVEKIENIRDYRQRLQEAEEYRTAKEYCEEESGRQIHQLELKKQRLADCLQEVKQRLAAIGGGLNEKAVAEIKALIDKTLE